MISKNISVLIVDDESESVEVIQKQLAKMGTFKSIVVAKDGFDALTKISNQNFGIIFIDLNMPKKGGLDILRSLASVKSNEQFHNNKIESIVICSGLLDKSSLQEAVKLGCKNFLTKPINSEKFQQIVIQIGSKA